MDNLFKCGAVGVMDSGIGGLTVLNALSISFPKLNFIYYGDNENAPYGNKSTKKLKKLALLGLDQLVLSGAKIIVVACNTLSTSILDYIKAVSPVPIIPTMPNPNFDASKFIAPCLIATPNTILSNFIKENFKSFNLIPLPFLAGEIERYILTPSKISVEKDLTALPENVDYLYLGCTHYILVKERIKANLPNVTIADNLQDVIVKLYETLPKTTIKQVKGKRIINFVGKSKEYNQTVYKMLCGQKVTAKNLSNP